MATLIDRSPRLTGVVIFHDAVRGFGKIRATDRLEYFFHADACRGYFETFVAETALTFSAGEDVGRGPRAVDVRRDVDDDRGNR